MILSPIICRNRKALQVWKMKSHSIVQNSHKFIKNIKKQLWGKALSPGLAKGNYYYIPQSPLLQDAVFSTLKWG